MRNLYILLAVSMSFFYVSPFGTSGNYSNNDHQKQSFNNTASQVNNRMFACPPVSAFSEDFNSIVTPALPTCWEKISNGGTVSTQAADANSAPNALYMASADDRNNVAIVALPSINNLGAATHRLRFSMRAQSTLGGTIEIGSVATSLNPNTFQPIQSVTASTLAYQTYIVAPGAVSRGEALAFRHTGNPTAGVLIDDVVWEPIPLCLAPTGISASSITGTSAVLSWTAPATVPVNYDVYLGTPATVPPADNATPFATGVTSPYTATGLVPSTNYSVWVRANCGANGKSSWSAVYAFTTGCDAASIPYSLNFDAGTSLGCVSIQNVNNDNRSWQITPSTTGYSGNSMTYFFGSNAANDWFFTQGISLTAGKSYVLSYKFGNNSTSFTEKLKVALGTTPSAAGMTTIIADYPSVNDNFPRVHKLRFTAPATNVFYIGFQAYSDANQFQLYVDEIAVTEANVAPTTVNTCVPVISPRIDQQSAGKWMALVDASGNIVGEINGNGNILGDVDVKVFRNSGAVRKDFYGRYYLDRNIEITPTAQPTTTVGVRLFFNAAEYSALKVQPNSNINFFTDVSVFKSSDPCGSRLNTGAAKITTTTSQYGADYVSEFSVNSFSSFYFAASAFSTLPATIVSFSGSRQGATNNLRWTVAQETDILEYSIERSENNGASWIKVGNVVSMGNTASQRSYIFSDNTFTGLKQLYRLRQVDRSGLAKLSSVVSISSAKPTKLALSGLFPNPATARLSMLIDAPQKDNINIEVLDATGRVLKIQQTSIEAGTNTVQLNVGSLTQGAYFIRISCTAGCATTTTRFVKE